MACPQKKLTTTWYQVKLVLFLIQIATADPQLDLPPLPQVSTQRNFGYGLSSTPANFQFSTARPVSSTPGIYPVSSTLYDNPRISPDISNNGHPNVDYGRNPSSTARPYDNDDRIDVNNDPNFRRNDPNFRRDDPNYVGVNPYDFNRGNRIDERVERVNLQQVKEFLLQADDQASKECTNNVAAQWNFETEVNDATQHAAVSTLFVGFRSCDIF